MVISSNMFTRKELLLRQEQIEAASGFPLQVTKSPGSLESSPDGPGEVTSSPHTLTTGSLDTIPDGPGAEYTSKGRGLRWNSVLSRM